MATKLKHTKTIPVDIGKRYFVIYDSIFHRRIHVLLNHDSKSYAKWLSKMRAIEVDGSNFDDFAGFSSTVTPKSGPTEFVIFVREFEWSIKSQGTLIHEIVHTVMKIWDSNNIPHDLSTQEFLAHSIHNLYEDIARKLLVCQNK